MHFTYRLDMQPTTFDFLTWLVAVKTIGANEMSFGGDRFKYKNNYPEEVAMSRLKNLLCPLAEMAALPIVPSREPTQLCSHYLRVIWKLWRDGYQLWRLPYEKKHDHVTVTRRKSFRHNHRDSNWPEWEKFIEWAEKNGQKVVVLDDDEKPIPPQERWDAYNCKMNLFVVGGPMNMCIHSSAPFLVFGFPGDTQDVYLQMCCHWIYRNSQLPWFKPNQRFVWSKDTFENIARAFEKKAV